MGAETSAKSGQDVNIEEVAQSGSQHSTQTREGEGGSGAGNGKPATGTEGAGTGDGGSAGGEGESDAFTPDKDVKYTHPETKQPTDLVTITKYYRDQFGASTKGAQDLLTQKATAEGERDTEKGKVAELSKKIEELTAIAEGKNPEGLKAHEIQAKLNETSEKLALVTESQALDSFERATPLATGAVRESLKALARANSSKSLQELYDANLKAGAEAAEAKRKADIEANKKGAGDKGKGTSTREPAGGGNTVQGTKGDTGLTLEEFNALPVAKRKGLIEKFGIN